MSNVQSGSIAAVAGLWRYPIKSMQGEELQSTRITERGLVGDRARALLDTATGLVISAKNPRKWPTMFEFRAAYAAPLDDAAALPAVRITRPDGTQLLTGQANTDEQLSRALGRGVRLVESPPAEAQLENLPPELEPGTTQEDAYAIPLPPGSFFDLAAVHLVTESTLNELSKLAPQSRFDTRRFRPNIVLRLTDGAAGFVENDWIGQTLCLGDEVRLSVMMPCPRCIMTTLPQGDLPKDPAVLRTAVQHNQGNVGVYAIVAQAGLVRRGDAVRLA